MNTVKSYKKQARIRARANGTSHQAELNAIAVENGHGSWGTFQKTLEAAVVRPDVVDGTDVELEELIRAFETAHRYGRHLVVLRSEPDDEVSAIAKLKAHMGVEDIEGPGVAFVAMLTRSAIEAADRRGITLITKGFMMASRISSGNCMVSAYDQVLDHTNALASRRDIETMTNTALIGARAATWERTPRSPWPPRSVSEAWNDADDLAACWNIPRESRPFGLPGGGFVPGWNVLNSVTMPSYAGHRRRYVERVADVLIPRNGRDYFRERGREALVGFLLAEIAEARGRRNDPSIPEMMNWMSRGHEAGDERNAFVLRLGRLPACHEADAAREILEPILSVAPNERAGILGAVDAALLPFRNPDILRLNV